MKNTTKQTATESLETLKQQIQSWRASRNGRRAMPEQLWQTAAGLARQSSTNRVARELGLNHSALMSRVRQLGAGSVREAEFIDVSGFSAAGFTCSCEIELEKACGTRLKITCTAGMDGSTIAAMWQEFLQYT